LGHFSGKIADFASCDRSAGCDPTFLASSGLQQTMTASGAVRIMRQIEMMRTIVIASVSDMLGGARSKIGPSHA